MSIKYKASFSYKSKLMSKFEIPVKIFRVWGGTARDINLNSTDDISISSEMEQARFYGSVSLGVSPNGSSLVTTAVVELINLAMSDEPIRVQFVVERYSGKKMLEGLALFKEDAIISGIPYSENNLLFIDLLISNASLYRGKLLRNFRLDDGRVLENYFDGKEV